MKWILPIVFIVLQLTLMFLCCFFYWTAVGILWAPGAAICRWLDISGEKNELALVLLNEACFAAAGFVVGVWLDDYERLRRGNRPDRT